MYEWREIPLTQGHVARVDAADCEWLMAYKWCYKQGYAATRIGTNANVRMHRLIAQAADGVEVDHRNGDTLDNRRSNLRICTHAENLRNRKHHSNNTSGYKGVYQKRGKWGAAIGVNYKRIHLGYFATAEEAGQAYDTAAQHYHGQFARAEHHDV